MTDNKQKLQQLAKPHPLCFCTLDLEIQEDNLWKWERRGGGGGGGGCIKIPQVKIIVESNKVCNFNLITQLR